MAGELKLFGSAVFAKGGSAYALESHAPLSVTVTGTKALRHRQSIPTTEEALVLGEVTPAGAFYRIDNKDTANAVTLRPAAGEKGTLINPGEFTMGRFPATVTAPVLIATTAAVEIDYLLVPA
jgi:hypothetical protein